ncbi:uncharacterized protein FOBCDRAFT_236200 [Fusarium oxysporum Fo47]|uniref:uncharacterized protein n=1 Tax=Fusarium oxysporum Fo47 TaxID=660027 RepID=UPI002869C5F7|nr:uncharacterized protein FOBCDRAFT_236200 [Fusarium oxysporum Fo47]WJG34590.1 hypothetical protein FOBCDRAFT_236200 [Fusarium oxysporum Fo47]
MIMIIEVGKKRAPNNLYVPTKAVSIPTGKTDKTQLSITDFRTVTSPSSSPTGKSLELDLSNAQFTPPNGRASFSLNIRKPLNIAPGELVNLIALIRMIMDEKSIYDKELETTGGKFEEVKSEKIAVLAYLKIKIIQKSGNNPVALTFCGLLLVKAERLAISR